jgi:hypothetical protein
LILKGINASGIYLRLALLMVHFADLWEADKAAPDSYGA